MSRLVIVFVCALLASASAPTHAQAAAGAGPSPCDMAQRGVDLPHACGLSSIVEYGNIRFADEKAQLDNFAILLMNNPSAQGYVIAYGGRVGRAGEAQRRVERVREYLVNPRGIDASRIVTVEGGYREELTVQLWLVPSGTTPPTAEPTVDPREVKFIKAAKARGRRRRP